MDSIFFLVIVMLESNLMLILNNNIVWRDLIHIYLFHFENMEKKQKEFFNNENEI
jgi:hypothetical protein